MPLIPDYVVVHRLNGDCLPDAIRPIVAEARADGHEFVDGLIERWTSGENHFSGMGEGLFLAWRDASEAELCGIAGVGIDPYLNDPQIARLRHVYVMKRYRRLGLAERLVRACLEQARGHFPIIRLRTENPEAARVYERIGFTSVSDPSASHIWRRY